MLSSHRLVTFLGLCLLGYSLSKQLIGYKLLYISTYENNWTLFNSLYINTDIICRRVGWSGGVDDLKCAPFKFSELSWCQFMWAIVRLD